MLGGVVMLGVEVVDGVGVMMMVVRELKELCAFSQCLNEQTVLL